MAAGQSNPPTPGGVRRGGVKTGTCLVGICLVYSRLMVIEAPGLGAKGSTSAPAGGYFSWLYAVQVHFRRVGGPQGVGWGLRRTLGDSGEHFWVPFGPIFDPAENHFGLGTRIEAMSRDHSWKRLHFILDFNDLATSRSAHSTNDQKHVKKTRATRKTPRRKEKRLPLKRE